MRLIDRIRIRRVRIRGVVVRIGVVRVPESRANEHPADKAGTEAASAMKATAMMEASAMRVPVAPVEPTPAPAMRPTTPLPPARVDRSGEGKGQHPHERQNDDLRHGQLLLDGRLAYELSPWWGLERGSARLEFAF